MARKLEAIKMGVDGAAIGQEGFDEGVIDVSYTIYIRGLEVTVFMHKLYVYVLLPEGDLEARDIVIRASKDILHDIREEFGREIKGISFLASYIN